MIKAILFDLDGVLADMCDLHYKALNLALKEVGYSQLHISQEERFIYEALPTKIKLEMLSKNKGLPTELHANINRLKQEKTISLINNGLTLYNEFEIISSLVMEDNLKLACCSNSVRKTIEVALQALAIRTFFDCIVSNEDVVCPKPSPECYIKAMNHFRVTPRETLVIDDSERGIEAGFASKAWVLPVKNCEALDLKLIRNFIKGINRYG